MEKTVSAPDFHGPESKSPELTVQAPELAPSPLGQVVLHGTIRNGHGVEPALPLRVYPDYAFVLITRGLGHYRDARGTERPVTAGDAVLVFPGLAHTYGPASGTVWDEAYLVFRGPAFAAWQEAGLLAPPRPVSHLPPGRDWAGEMAAVYDHAPDRAEPLRQSLRVCRLLAFLTEALLTEALLPANMDGPAVPVSEIPAGWAAEACRRLADPDRPQQPVCEVAASFGMSVETFRRRFRRQVGDSPARWRAKRHLEAACHWMQYTQMTNAAIAARLGFGDEFHFSRRFRQLLGETPTEFRRRLRGPAILP